MNYCQYEGSKVIPVQAYMLFTLRDDISLLETSSRGEVVKNTLPRHLVRDVNIMFLADSASISVV